MKSLFSQLIFTVILGVFCGVFIIHSSDLTNYQNSKDTNYYNWLITTVSSLVPELNTTPKRYPAIDSSLKDPDDNFDEDWPSQLARRVEDTRCKWARGHFVYTACKRIAKKCHAEHGDYDMQDMCVQRGILKKFNIKHLSFDD